MKRVVLVLFSFLFLMTGGVVAQRVGDVFCADGSIVSLDSFAPSGKEATGVVYHTALDSVGNRWGWVVELRPKTDLFPWGGYKADFGGPGFYRYYWIDYAAIEDTCGAMNTRALHKVSKITEEAAVYSIDDESGWEMPAAGQLLVLMQQVDSIRTTFTRLGVDFPFDYDGYYWSSSSSDRFTSWTIGRGCVPVLDARFKKHRVVAVRRFTVK